MSNPTTYFGWQMPEPTDLVTDLPADFEVFGQAVDTDFQDLLGGTTGQVLSKTSATDLDFTWINNDTGDITGITAGNGITVTSPTGPVPTVAIDTAVTVDLTTAQTLTNKTLTSPALTTPTISTLTTNGDLLYGTGSGALARRGIGSTGNVLTVSGGLPVWSAPAGGGKLLQVVEGTYNTNTSTSSSTLSDTGLTATITPSSASSKVLVFVVHNGLYMSQPSSGSNSMKIAVFRGATNISAAEYTYATAALYGGTGAQSILDSPATTSATTYKTQFSAVENKASVTISADGRNRASIILMEIGA